MLKLLSSVVLFCSATLTSVHASDSVSVTKNSAWIRATPPGVTTTAAYLTLENHSSKDVNLTAVSSALSDKLELHTHTSHDGMMKMQQIDSIPLPAKGSAQLKPHGDHIMVFNLRNPLKPEQEVNLMFVFDNGQELSVKLPVYKEAPSSKMAHNEGHMHKKEKHDHEQKNEHKNH